MPASSSMWRVALFILFLRAGARVNRAAHGCPIPGEDPVKSRIHCSAFIAARPLRR